MTMLAAAASGLVGQLQGDGDDDSDEDGTGPLVVGMSIWVGIVTVALAVLSVVVYRKLQRQERGGGGGGGAADTHSVSSGSRTSSDLSDFVGDSVMTSGAAGSGGAAAGIDNDSFTIDTIPEVHHQSAATSSADSTQPVTVRL